MNPSCSPIPINVLVALVVPQGDFAVAVIDDVVGADGAAGEKRGEGDRNEVGELMHGGESPH